MSLINEALRDLDARGLPAGFPSIEDGEHSTASTAIKFRPVILVQVLFAAVGAAGFAGYVTMVAADRRSDTPAPIVAAHGSSDLENTAFSQAPVGDAQKTPGSATVHSLAALDLHSLPKPEAPVLEVAVAGEETGSLPQFLTQAAAALARNRLTRPENSSAMFFVNRALVIAPDSEDAREIKIEIKRRYQRELDQAIAERNVSRAENLLERFYLVEPDESEHGHYTDRVSQLLAADAQLSRARLQEHHAQASDAQLAERGSWIKSTLASRDRRVFASALAKAQRGRLDDMEKQLLDFVGDNPDAFHSYKLLLEHYLEKGRLDDARALLGRLPKDHPGRIIFTAQLIAKTQDAAAAIVVLESTNAGFSRSREHQALLAALYHKNKQFKEAKRLYQSLLASYPKDLNYLLGLGVSHDALGQRRASLAVYRSILARGHENLTVSNFVQRRVAELDPQSLAGNINSN